MGGRQTPPPGERSVRNLQIPHIGEGQAVCCLPMGAGGLKGFSDTFDGAVGLEAVEKLPQ